MLKAVIQNGTIRPLEPLPDDWGEGQALRIEKADGDGEISLGQIDADFACLHSLCQSSDPAEEERLDKALQEARQQAKELVRRHMGIG